MPGHETIEGVLDTGGRVYFEIPSESRLGIGRHRLLFVVRGDHTMTSQFIEVVPPGTRFVVTDVDGTQTESEEAEVTTVLGGPSPAAQLYGPELMWAFANRGYRILYLTARPEWLHMRTHEWTAERGYPPGLVRTTLSYLPAMGSDALNFKTAALESHLRRFPDSIDYTVGNTNTDTAAFAAAGMPPERSYLYQYDPGSLGTRVDDYSTLIPVVDALPEVCE
jgi:phosphatidate phosphatase PAH1